MTGGTRCVAVTRMRCDVIALPPAYIHRPLDLSRRGQASDPGLLLEHQKVQQTKPLDIFRAHQHQNQKKAYVIPTPQLPTMPIGQSESGVTSGVKFVTSTVGNTVGGVTNTVGGVVGALGRGVAETVEGATGSAGRPVARGLADATTSVEDGANRVAGGVKRAGEGK